MMAQYWVDDQHIPPTLDDLHCTSIYEQPGVAIVVHCDSETPHYKSILRAGDSSHDQAIGKGFWGPLPAKKENLGLSPSTHEAAVSQPPLAKLQANDAPLKRPHDVAPKRPQGAIGKRPQHPMALVRDVLGKAAAKCRCFVKYTREWLLGSHNMNVGKIKRPSKIGKCGE